MWLGLFVWLFMATAYKGLGLSETALTWFFGVDPLIGVSTWIAAHEVPAIFLLSLGTVALTVVMGRVFCGWICPLGTIHAMASVFRRGSRMLLARTEAWTKWLRAKYYLLAALLVMSLFGTHWIGLFDPLSLLYRTLTTTLLPAVQYAVEEGSTAIYQADPKLGPLKATSLSEPVYRFFRDHVFKGDRQAYLHSAGIAVVFVAIVLLNLYRKRFWCRYVCPLGALLGVLARWPLFRRECSGEVCTNCGVCRADCQGAAMATKAKDWAPSECFMCMGCGAACAENAIAFRFRNPFRAAKAVPIDASKRALLASGAAGVGTLLALRLTPQAQAVVYNPGLIRPPGAEAERAFLEKCIQCGVCMKVCPTNALHPALFAAGIEGLWTPQLVAKIGYCEYECNRCGLACPTEAIAPLTKEAKKKVRMGLATVDTTRCLPYAYGRNCIICEEHCPTPKKAIYFRLAEVQLRDGSTVTLKQPWVDPDLCIGCGICENKCVFRDFAAIRVTSANESRHSGNMAILPGAISSQQAPPETAPESASPYSSNPYGN